MFNYHRPRSRSSWWFDNSRLCGGFRAGHLNRDAHIELGADSSTLVVKESTRRPQFTTLAVHVLQLADWEVDEIKHYPAYLRWLVDEFCQTGTDPRPTFVERPDRFRYVEPPRRPRS